MACASGRPSELVVVVVVAGLLQAGPCQSYSFKTGQCKAISPTVSDFSITKFLGTWQVIQGYNVASRCYSITIKEAEGVGSYALSVDKQLFSLRAAGIIHNLHYEAQLYPNPDDPASMVLRLPSHLYRDISYTVIGTDYNTWAVLWSCTSAMFGHLESALILARKSNLPLNELMEIRGKLQGLGVDLDEISSVQQSDCKPKLGGGFFTLELAPGTSKIPIDWDTLIPAGDMPALSPTGCFIQENGFYLYYEVCPSGSKNVVFKPSEDGAGNSSTTTVGSEGSLEGNGITPGDEDSGNDVEYYYYYIEETSTDSLESEDVPDVMIDEIEEGSVPNLKVKEKEKDSGPDVKVEEENSGPDVKVEEKEEGSGDDESNDEYDYYYYEYYDDYEYDEDYDYEKHDNENTSDDKTNEDNEDDEDTEDSEDYENDEYYDYDDGEGDDDYYYYDYYEDYEYYEDYDDEDEPEAETRALLALPSHEKVRRENRKNRPLSVTDGMKKKDIMNLLPDKKSITLGNSFAKTTKFKQLANKDGIEKTEMKNNLQKRNKRDLTENKGKDMKKIRNILKKESNIKEKTKGRKKVKKEIKNRKRNEMTKKKRKKNINQKKRKKNINKKGKKTKERKKNTIKKKGKKTKKRKKKNRRVAKLIMVSARLQQFLASKNVDIKRLPIGLRFTDLMALFSDPKERKKLLRLLRFAKRKWRVILRIKKLKAKGKKGLKIIRKEKRRSYPKRIKVKRRKGKNKSKMIRNRRENMKNKKRMSKQSRNKGLKNKMKGDKKGLGKEKSKKNKNNKRINVKKDKQHTNEKQKKVKIQMAKWKSNEKKRALRRDKKESEGDENIKGKDGTEKQESKKVKKLARKQKKKEKKWKREKRKKSSGKKNMRKENKKRVKRKRNKKKNKRNGKKLKQ
ncbi:uncharacterized protein [Panulirus ornatus]|uniref:uncharacterized protein n=1 Tax=Panulirus ornatus TaxID=150431 RepID=UPI003A8AB37A